MSGAELFFRFGIALAIGFLVGLQREFSTRSSEATSFAGVRTFTLLSLGGCAAAFVAETAGSPLVLVAFVGVVGALVIASYLTTARSGDVGTTTEVAALVTALNGALCYGGELQMAAAIGVATTVILSVKPPLQKLVAKLTTEDLMATLKFAVVTAIVLPVLPREPLGSPPFDVLVPYELWLMVVFISALGFAGYVLIQVVGPKRGIGLTGVLGGLVSSTALTLSFSQKSRADENLAKPFAIAIVVAWTMMFARILAAVAVVNRELLGELWFPLAAAGTAGALYGVWLDFLGPGVAGHADLLLEPLRIGSRAPLRSPVRRGAPRLEDRSDGARRQGRPPLGARCRRRRCGCHHAVAFGAEPLRPGTEHGGSGPGRDGGGDGEHGDEGGHRPRDRLLRAPPPDVAGGFGDTGHGTRLCVRLEIEPIVPSALFWFSMEATNVVRAWGRILSGYFAALSIEITKECPLSCPGCYAFQPEHLGGAPLTSVSDFKGDVLVEKVLALVSERRPLVVYFVGGEPLVRFRELSEILPRLEEKRIYARVVTSAVRPIPIEWAGAKFTGVVVSIDGLQPEHDERRKPATYDRILKHIAGTSHRRPLHRYEPDDASARATWKSSWTSGAVVRK